MFLLRDNLLLYLVVCVIILLLFSTDEMIMDFYAYSHPYHCIVDLDNGLVSCHSRGSREGAWRAPLGWVWLDQIN